jgi:hypothetical protein
MRGVNRAIAPAHHPTGSHTGLGQQGLLNRNKTWNRKRKRWPSGSSLSALTDISAVNLHTSHARDVRRGVVSEPINVAHVRLLLVLKLLFCTGGNCGLARFHATVVMVYHYHEPSVGQIKCD